MLNIRKAINKFPRKRLWVTTFGQVTYFSEYEYCSPTVQDDHWIPVARLMEFIVPTLDSLHAGE